MFTMIEEAARSTHYSNTIQPFKTRKNGRGAWSALISSHVGEDKWEAIQKKNRTWLMSTKWMGKSYSLEVFCSQHRAKHSQLEEAALHVQFQVPDERTRVGYLIDNIEHQNADLRAAIAQVRTNSSGTRNDFEKSVSILLPVDPYVKTPANKKVSFEVSSVGATKFGRGKKTGVDLRWMKKEEFAALSKDEKSELREWQTTVEGKNKTKGNRDSYFREKGNKRKDSGGDDNAN